MYIIIWRDKDFEAFLNVNDRNVIERFHSYESAQNMADKVVEENPTSEWYFDYQIYQSVNS